MTESTNQASGMNGILAGIKVVEFAQNAAVGGRVSERLFEAGLCLPSGSALSEDQIDRITAVIRAQVP